MKKSFRLLRYITGEYAFVPPVIKRLDLSPALYYPWCCSMLTDFIPWLQPPMSFTVSNRKLSPKSTRMELTREECFNYFDITTKYYQNRDLFIPIKMCAALELTNIKQQTIIRYFTSNN